MTCFDNSMCAAEVIGMRMSDVDGMHSRQRDVCVAHSILKRGPGFVAGETGIDECEASGIFDRVGIHMAKAGEVGGKLQAQDAARYFSDFGGGVFLFLARHTRRFSAVCMPVVIVCVPHDVPTLPPDGGGPISRWIRRRGLSHRADRTCLGSSGVRKRFPECRQGRDGPRLCGGRP